MVVANEKSYLVVVELVRWFGLVSRDWIEHIGNLVSRERVIDGRFSVTKPMPFLELCHCEEVVPVVELPADRVVDHRD